MAATYSLTRAPRCCGEYITYSWPTCDCIICGKQYPTQPIVDFYLNEVLPRMSPENRARATAALSRM